MKRLTLFFSLLLLPMCMLNAQSMPGGEMSQLQGFARAIDISNGVVFVGQPNNYHQPGTVFVFNKNGNDWTQSSQVMASDGIIGDRFGAAISADGSRLLVGAPMANDRSGAAYIFERSRSGEWVEKGLFTITDESENSRLGSSVLLEGELAFVGAPNHADGKGAVLVYRRSGSGEWTFATNIMNPDTATSNFGSVLAFDGTTLAVSAPDREGGTVFAFTNEGNQWTKVAALTSDQVAARSSFGSALSVNGDMLLVSAPRDASARGTVVIFRKQGGEWTESGLLAPFDGQSRNIFGSSLAVTGSEVWVGAPYASGHGLVYRFMMDDEGMWSGSSKLTSSEAGMGDAFASTLAVEGNLAVVGMTGDDYGAGSAVIMEKNSSDEWMSSKLIIGEMEGGLEAITGRRVSCEGQKAGQFGCNNVDLISFLPISDIGGGRGVRLNDIWGWTDPETGKEYALVGRNEGTSFVDMSDPGNPVYVGNLPMTEGARANVWRDIKVYKNHAYIVADGAGEHGMQVLDLTQLREFEGEPLQLKETALYTGIHSAHNVVINEETGYAYIVGSSGGGNTCGGGLHMVNIQDPANPKFEGCFSDPSTGRSGTGYSHDAQCVIYNGPDTEHQGKEICFGANETAVSIADVTDKQNPIALSTASYPDYGYVHQGWLTEDHRYFFQNDELDELMGTVENTRTMVWDVTDLDDPQLVREFYIEIPSSDHNLYIKDNKMYQSNYVSGLQVIDVSDPANPVKVGEFDTNPFTDDAPGFSGTWSNYPFFKSGLVVMTSGNEGIFILDTNVKAINQ